MQTEGEADEGEDEEAPPALAPLDQDAPVDGGVAWTPVASSFRADLQHQARPNARHMGLYPCR